MTLEYFTKEQVAKLLHISPRTLNYWLAKRGFPQPMRIGRRCLWSNETVDGFLKEQEGMATKQDATPSNLPVSKSRPVQRKAGSGMEFVHAILAMQNAIPASNRRPRDDS